MVWLRQPEEGEVCECCGRPLKNECRMLELDQRDDTYHDRGDVPEANSQGWFPFGKTCAQRLNKEGKKA